MSECPPASTIAPTHASLLHLFWAPQGLHYPTLWMTFCALVGWQSGNLSGFWPNCIVTSPSLHSADLLSLWAMGTSVLSLWKGLNTSEVPWNHIVSLCPDPTPPALSPSFADPFLLPPGALNAFPTLLMPGKLFQVFQMLWMPADATVSTCSHPP